MLSVNISRWTRRGAISLCALIAGTANADLSNVVFSVSAVDASGRSGSFSITQEMGTWSGDTFTWSSSSPVPIWDSTRQVQLGTLNPAADGSPAIKTQIEYVNDPQINLNFAVQAGSSTTSFTITSALLSFPTITNASGTASAGYSVSDLTGDGVSLNGVSGAGAYLAQYNGFVPTGTTFLEAISSVTAPAFSSQTQNASFTDPAMSNPVNDMSVQVQFTLSPFDLASGTTTYVITPEPASLVLLLAGLAVLKRR